MSSLSVRIVIPVISAGMMLLSGCCHVPRNGDLVNAQTHARDLYAENQRLLAASEQANQMLLGLDFEKQSLASQLGETQSQLSTTNDRLKNLMAERNELTDRIARAMNDNYSDGSGTNSALDAAGFEYDPATGLNKFRSDILFDLGSDLKTNEHKVYWSLRNGEMIAEKSFKIYLTVEENSSAKIIAEASILIEQKKEGHFSINK